MIGDVAQRASSPVFVGRSVELGRLRAALERAAAGAPAVVVVAGEAGVGKTRLVTEVIGPARELGALTLAGGCLDVGDGVLAYAPVVEALRSLALVLDAAELDRVLGGSRAELARLVPELGAPAAGADPVDPAWLFEHLLGALHRMAERRPVLLVVEDVHWADRSTRHLLSFLVRNLRAGVCVVLTYRSDDLHRRHPLRPFLAELGRSGLAERLELARLGRRELTALLAGILGAEPPPALVTEIMTRSGGNPFFAEELLAAHRDGTVLPSALRDVVLARVDALPGPTRGVLQVAAVAGRRVDHALLTAVSGRPAEALVGLLREAVAGHVLVPEGSGEGYSFRHALVQEAIYDELLPMERAPLHAAYARALTDRVQARGEGGTVAELGQLAYHTYAAHDLGAALLASVRAGQAAEAAYALAEAVAHYERALELWDQVPGAAARSPLDRNTLLRRAAEAACLSGEPDRAIALVKLALDATDAAAEPLRAGALLERQAHYHWVAADTQRAMSTMERAVATTPEQPPSRERARALGAKGQLLMLLSRNAEACAYSEEAIAVARQVGAGARVAEANALITLGTSVGIFGQLEVARRHFDRARRIAEEAGNADELCRVHLNLGSVLLAAGHWEEAMGASLETARLARRFGAVRTYGSGSLPDAAQALHYLGRWDEGRAILDDLFELDLAPPTAIPRLQTRALYRLHRGDLAGARADLVAILESCPSPLDPQFSGPLFTRLAAIALQEGRLEAARDAVAEGLASLAHSDSPTLVCEICRTGLAVEAAIAERAGAGRADGDMAAARTAADSLLARARAAATADHVVSMPLLDAWLAGAEAEWSRAAGHSDPERWAATGDAWEKLGCPHETAYARLRQSEALLGVNPPRDAVAALLRGAARTADELGARPLAAEITALARRTRIELAPADRSEASGTEGGVGQPAEPGDSLGLTAREREVLALLAEGRTNRQIAAALFISDKTASVHVSNILAKLHVANRGEAAAVAHRLGLG
jgi:ATP/maltotriose-dependent transcriptional regulator MalT